MWVVVQAHVSFGQRIRSWPGGLGRWNRFVQSPPTPQTLQSESGLI